MKNLPWHPFPTLCHQISHVVTMDMSTQLHTLLPSFPCNWLWPCKKASSKGMWQEVMVATLERNVHVPFLSGPLSSILVTEHKNGPDMKTHVDYTWVIPPGLLTHFYPAIQRTESLSCLGDLFMGFLYYSSLTYTLTNIKPGSVFPVLGLFSVMDNRAHRSLWWKRRWKYELGTGPYWILKLCKTLGLHLKISVQHDYECPLERTLQLNCGIWGEL